MKRTALIALALLAGCQPTSQVPTITNKQAADEAELQRELALTESTKLENRARDVWFRIASANVDLCGETTVKYTGVTANRADKVPKENQAAMLVLFNVDDKVTVITTIKGSPADLAGLKPNDKILKANGKVIEDLGKMSSEIQANDSTTLDITRNGQPLTVTLTPVRVCNYPIGVPVNDSVNAWADGKTINVTSAMMRFVESDDELALIIGHEMGHNIMDHIGKKKGNVIAGAVLDGVVATVLKMPSPGNTFSNMAGNAFSQDFESEADYVGTYYAARAGYDVSVAKNLWRRMAATHPAGIHLEGGSHPSTAKRVLAIAETQDEIEHKKAAGQPLVPTQK